VKLVVAVVQAADAGRVMDALLGKGFEVTKIDSTGGFLRERNATLLVSSADQYADEARAIIRQFTQARATYVNPLMPILEPTEFLAPNPLEVVIGGASVFTLRVSRYVRME
jgi:uncharacterized protein YaaQ